MKDNIYLKQKELKISFNLFQYEVQYLSETN